MSQPTPQIIGQDQAHQEFWQSSARGKMAQSWIFAGPKGVGKSTFAKSVVRELLSGTISAQALPEPSAITNSLFAEPVEIKTGPAANSVHDPEHPLYRKVMGGTHPDLLTIDASPKEGEKKKSTELNVDSIRQVGTFLRSTAGEGSWRIVIVDDAEMMNKNAANALLKILEEPPPRSLIILIASVLGYFPPTIRSRCRVLRFMPLSDDVLRDYLQTNFPQVMGRDQETLIALSEGSIGQMQMLVQGDGLALYAELQKFFGYLAARDLRWPAWHALAEKMDARMDVAHILWNKALQSAIFPSQSGRVDLAIGAELRQMRPPASWLKFYDDMQALVAKQQFLYLDGKQSWLSLMAKLAA